MNKQIKAVLLDFDGTTLQNDQVFISLRNMQAIKRCLANGIIVIPSTGRSADMFPPQIAKLSEVRYWVTSNGARVIDRLSNEQIYAATFTPEESASIMNLFAEQQIYCEIAAAGKIFLEASVNSHLYDFKVPPHHVWYVDAEKQIAKDNLAKYFLENKIGIEKLNFYDVPANKFTKLEQALIDLGCTSIVGSKQPDIQCFPKRLNRAMALDALFARLHIDFSNVMSIGDSVLDAELLQKSKIGVAVDNASNEIKEIADYVVASNQNDGVAEAIEKFILN